MAPLLLAEDIEGVGRSKLMALTDWILGGLRAGSNLGVEIRGMLADSCRGLYIEDWGGGEHAMKALLREMMGLDLIWPKGLSFPVH